MPPPAGLEPVEAVPTDRTRTWLPTRLVAVRGIPVTSSGAPIDRGAVASLPEPPGPPLSAHLRALASSITLAAMCGGSSS